MLTVTLIPTKMKSGETKLQLKTPYSPTLPAKCRAIGGKWGAGDKAWYFDQRDSDRVRALCLETFGIDPLAEPDEAPELVTVRWYLEPVASPPTEDEVVRAREQRLADDAWMFGREILRRPGRDSAVRVGDGVVIIRGGFAGFGGSRANPAIGEAKAGTVVEIRDVPRALAEAHVAKHPHVVEILADAPEPERVDPATVQIGALFGTLAPATQRAVILSMVGTIPRDERPALLEELRQYLEQGAI
jgi:hypothetical protein